MRRPLPFDAVPVASHTQLWEFLQVQYSPAFQDSLIVGPDCQK